MMSISIGRYFNDYTKSKKILKEFSIDIHENQWCKKSLKKSDLSQEFISVSTENDYKLIYETARKKEDYNFLFLKDESIVQFGYDIDNKNEIVDLRYAFYDKPFNHLNYIQFLEENDIYIEDDDMTFFEEYQQYLSEAELKSSVTPIRYDYSKRQYDGLVHSISHLHIGHLNDIRIPLSYVMTPVNFISFILRHVYWSEWKEFIQIDNNKQNYLNNFKPVVKLDDKYFSSEERNDSHISII